jgi:5'-nucleotidase
MTMGDILEILPFEDPVIVLELDGATLWETLENALAKYPALEG